MKRIAILMSSDDFAVRSGIGHWCLSVVNNLKENHFVDIITANQVKDLRKTSELLKLFPDVNIISPKSNNFSSDKIWNQSVPGIKYEHIVGYQESLREAFKTRLYDMVICNHVESFEAALNLNLNKVMPVLFFTHTPQLIYPEYKDGYRKQQWYDREVELVKTSRPNVTVLTHSELNKKKLELMNVCNVATLEPTVPETSLLKNHNVAKDGILFIGRYEDRKDPETFLKLVKLTNKKAKILCAGKHDKWHKKCKDLNIDYEVVNLTGKDKAKFIQSCEYAFMTSKQESYGLGAFESLHACPTIFIDYKWTEAFTNFSNAFFVSSVEEAAKLVSKGVNFNLDENLKIMNSIHQSRKSQIEKYFIENKITGNAEIAKVLDKEEKIEVKDWWNRKNRIDSFDIEEVFTFYRNGYFKHTKNLTFLVKNISVEVKETNLLPEFFEFD